jgi:hypothetical protein
MSKKTERWVLVALDSFQGQYWGRVNAAGSELAVEAARRLLMHDNAVDCAVREEYLVPR